MQVVRKRIQRPVTVTSVGTFQLRIDAQAIFWVFHFANKIVVGVADGRFYLKPISSDLRLAFATFRGPWAPSSGDAILP